MKQYFGPQGLLAQKVPSFEFRAQQLEMAETVAECLRDEIPLLVEAGTGTGKTWAYLIPAILSGKKVVISTGTKTLQDQIFDHDIPLFKRLFFKRLHAVCLKGRKNYLCQRRFQDFAYQPSLWSPRETKLFRRLQKWTTRTITGDRAEIPWLPDGFKIWNEISSSSDQCLGQGCEEHSRCFITRLRQEAFRADLLVVNHYLFFADLAIRKGGFGEVIPEYEAVIFDEAHQLEDIIGSYFSIEFSNYKIHELIHDVQREFDGKSKKIAKVPEIRNLCEHLNTLVRQIHHHFQHSAGSQGRFLLDLEKAGKGFVDLANQMIHALGQLSASVTPHMEAHPALESCSRRALELRETIQVLLDQEDSSLVYWYESTPQGVFLNGTPLEVAPIVEEHLFQQTSAVVLTSATLSAAGTFDFIRERLGMPVESKELLLASPFSYDQQALLYIPARFPLPKEAPFCTSVAQEALKILTRTRGRALFLFTSYQNLRQVHQHLREHLPFPILVQGQKPKRTLLAEFKENIESVLLATSSFWQGIDVPGEALSCVLIDKLPFDVPSDPLTAARIEQLSEEGKNPFYNYQIPRAIIHLKQGIGRLIRSSQDRGIIVIFDVRILNKTYGHLFLESLPSYQRIHHLEELDDFLNPRGLSQRHVGVLSP
jgi:ATP-dependent DNA helicase DinG